MLETDILSQHQPGKEVIPLLFPHFLHCTASALFGDQPYEGLEVVSKHFSKRQKDSSVHHKSDGQIVPLSQNQEKDKSPRKHPSKTGDSRNIINWKLRTYTVGPNPVSL